VTDPGWYPDPLRLWDVRWWDGNAWNEAVRTGTWQDVEPLVTLDQLVAAAPGDGLVWHGKRSADLINTEQYVVTGNSVRMYTDMSRPPKAEFALWTIARAEPRVNAGQGLLGVGDVVLTISYKGFAGRTTEVLKNVPEPARAAAIITRMSRLARLVAGYPEPEVPRR
jgi:hypothetical protein